MKRILALCFFALSCSSSPTQVRLRLEYDEAWPLTTFGLSARDKLVRLHALTPDGTKTREFVVSISDDWAGESITYTVRAYVGVSPRDELYASGHATVIAVQGQTVDEVVVFARTACATWCTPGSTFCRSGGVMVCEMSETGCPRWGRPEICAEGQSCSLGECGETCVDECAQGETRCSGPLGVELCGQSDNDSCRDWQEPILCEGAQLCSNGRCADSCTSECESGQVRCRDGGVSTCADVNNDGCYEWGPSVSCASSETCSGTSGVRGETGVAACSARESCHDECTANSCTNNMFTACGNFDQDPCLEPSGGLTCTSPDLCEEGTCDLEANNGMGGCVTVNRTCTRAEEATCVSTTMQRVFDNNGSCNPVDGQCVYPHRDIPCRTCTAESVDCGDRCAGVTCAELPTVETMNLACYVRNSGQCSDGSCNYQFNNGSCDDTNPCTINDACASGQCRGTAMDCSGGRSPTCEDGIARTYASAGMCMNGACAYSVLSEQTCALGCSGNRCRGACEGVTCASLPSVPAADRACYVSGSGMCADGTCSYTTRTGSCDDGNSCTVSDSCASGVCRGTAMLCNGGRAAECVSGVARTFAMMGTCSSGSCVYATTSEQTCANGCSGSQCAAGNITVANAAGRLAVGSSHLCFINSNGTVSCKGDNTYGQLGNGDQMDSSTPVLVSGINSAVWITSRWSHNCAVLSNGRVMCWGRGRYGVLGDGQTGNAPTPVEATGITDAVQVSSGRFAVCARLRSGGVRCWGGNDFGELGRGIAGNSFTPVAVEGITNAISVSVGDEHACAALASGGVRCWGNGLEGKLGNGSTTEVNLSPVAVSNLSDAVEVAVGQYHSCALRSGGAVSCWGANDTLQLGRTGITHSTTPVSLSNLSNVVSLTGGASHACAILSDGTGRCWGWNSYGQLGTTGVDRSATPLVVDGLASARWVRAGVQSTCAFRADSTIQCWGDGRTERITVP